MSKGLELSKRLDGCKYRSELTSDDINFAKANGLVVVYGASDDLIEFSGCLDDELGAGDKEVIHFHSGNILSVCDPFYELDEMMSFLSSYGVKFNLDNSIKISREFGIWGYDMNCEYFPFNVYEDGDLYGVGIVFNLKDIIG